MAEKRLWDTRLNRVDVIGVPITSTNMVETISFLEEELCNIRGEYICVSNAHTCVMAHEDPEYWACQSESIMSVPDGKPLSIVGSKKVSSMGRVTGPDLMREVFDASQKNGWTHYFYGDRKGTLESLRSELKAAYPEIEIVGMEPSVFRPLSTEEKGDLVRRINSSGADFCWVALGAPRQEVLMHELKGSTNSLMVGVGGAFNVLAGKVPEAPRWMQNLSLEWLYRLMQEPRRLFKRYAVTNTKFLFYQFTKAKRKEGNE